MNKSYTLLAVLVSSASFAQAASMAINFSRDGFNAPAASISDFQAADANLEGSGTFLQRSGTNGTPFTGLSSTSVGAFTVTTANAVTSVANAGNLAWNDLASVSEGYIYVDSNSLTSVPTVTISGLAALGAGQAITLTMYGVGDNVTQDSVFNVTYGAANDSGETAYNDGGARASSTGAIPFVQSSFTSDGTTDAISFTVGQSGGARYYALNGFSLSVVPEPSTTALLGLSGFALLLRRRR